MALESSEGKQQRECGTSAEQKPGGGLFLLTAAAAAALAQPQVVNREGRGLVEKKNNFKFKENLCQS